MYDSTLSVWTIDTITEYFIIYTLKINIRSFATVLRAKSSCEERTQMYCLLVAKRSCGITQIFLDLDSMTKKNNPESDQIIKLDIFYHDTISFKYKRGSHNTFLRVRIPYMIILEKSPFLFKICRKVPEQWARLFCLFLTDVLFLTLLYI